MMVHEKIALPPAGSRLAFVVCVGADDAAGIDDRLAMLALAHIAAELFGLGEGEPVRQTRPRGVALPANWLVIMGNIVEGGME